MLLNNSLVGLLSRIVFGKIFILLSLNKSSVQLLYWWTLQWQRDFLITVAKLEVMIWSLFDPGLDAYKTDKTFYKYGLQGARCNPYVELLR